MLVLLDTNAFHGDVHARRGALSTLFAFAERRDDIQIVVPAGVVEELVRQFGERLGALKRDVKQLSYDLKSLGYDVPALPDEPLDQATASYRASLAHRLDGPHRSVASHPADSSRIIDWVAQRRHPIRPRAAVDAPSNEPSGHRSERRRRSVPVDGVVDAGIWLTLIELAKEHRREVVLVTRNTADFADPEDTTKLHPLLIADLASARIAAGRIELQPTVLDFNTKYIEPSAQAESAARKLLSESGSRAALISEIEDAVDWFPLSLDSSWNLEVDIDESAMSEFAVSGVDLVRADPAPKGFFMQIRARGTARFDLGIRKADAHLLAEDSPIYVYDWDWNESMVAAEVEQEADLSIEVLVEGEGPDYNLGVLIERVEPTTA